ncbi:CBS domain-containing protein [Pseudomonas sp. SP16.1]|uniref:CBS domain-containing protein n=1 Tax=Pseudomonas sp. SP16.1 TaxID=3458854 RepID=UPI004046547E
MSIGKYCNRDVVIAAPDVSILTAARLMRDYHVGDLVLAERIDPERFRPVGIVTDRDIVLEIVANDEVDLERIRVGDIQMRDLVSAWESEDVFEVIDRMRHFNVRRLPIVDGEGALVGIVSADDLLGVLANYLEALSLLVGYQNLCEDSECDQGL